MQPGLCLLQGLEEDSANERMGMHRAEQNTRARINTQTQALPERRHLRTLWNDCMAQDSRREGFFSGQQ